LHRKKHAKLRQFHAKIFGTFGAVAGNSVEQILLLVTVWKPSSIQPFTTV
jgi:hypothetical protein